MQLKSFSSQLAALKSNQGLIIEPLDNSNLSPLLQKITISTCLSQSNILPTKLLELFTGQVKIVYNSRTNKRLIQNVNTNKLKNNFENIQIAKISSIPKRCVNFESQRDKVVKPSIYIYL